MEINLFLTSRRLDDSFERKKSVLIRKFKIEKMQILALYKKKFVY